MKHVIVLSLAVLLAPGLAAQRDSTRQPGDTMEAARLRAEVERRFTSRVTDELHLTADQATKLQASQEKFSARRRTIMTQQRDRRQALDDQMEPGIAANSDSVNKLLAGVRSGRVELLRLDQDQDEEMSKYLTPVQRARYEQIRERFMDRVTAMRKQRRGRDSYGMERAPRQGSRRRPI
jgi:Spy/CpxP family protein refolding chaperone